MRVTAWVLVVVVGWVGRALMGRKGGSSGMSSGMSRDAEWDAEWDAPLEVLLEGFFRGTEGFWDFLTGLSGTRSVASKPHMLERVHSLGARSDMWPLASECVPLAFSSKSAHPSSWRLRLARRQGRPSSGSIEVMNRWEAATSDGGNHVHVLPLTDEIAHLEDDGGECVCGPTIEPVPRADGSVGWLITHESLGWYD